MSSALKFYVRVIVDNGKKKLLFHLYDLDLSIKSFFLKIKDNLNINCDAEDIKNIDGFLMSNHLLCWNRKYSINSKFSYLISKIETVKESEVDIFELKLVK